MRIRDLINLKSQTKYPIFIIQNKKVFTTDQFLELVGEETYYEDLLCAPVPLYDAGDDYINSCIALMVDEKLDNISILRCKRTTPLTCFCTKIRDKC